MSQSKRSSKDKYLDSLKKRYAKASKKERGQILDEYVQTTGYHRVVLHKVVPPIAIAKSHAPWGIGGG
jgi:hypothetical protein